MIVPRRYTSILAALLFFVFGVRMMKEGFAMDPGNSSVQDEIKEVEQELQGKDFTTPISPISMNNPFSDSHNTVNAEALEQGDWKPRRKNSLSSSALLKTGTVKRVSAGIMNLMNLLFSPVFVQTFVMTFLGEWGDRSQIATITLAAASDFWAVTIGTVIAHGCCTALAVIGGRYLASKISVKHGTPTPLLQLLEMVTDV